MTQPQDKMRAEFEAWAEPDHPIRRGFGKQNDYDFVHVRRLWEAWQAACAQQSAQSQQDALAPLTDEQIEKATGAKRGEPLFLVAKGFTIAVETAHGITHIATQGASNV